MPHWLLAGTRSKCLILHQDSLGFFFFLAKTEEQKDLSLCDVG